LALALCLSLAGTRVKGPQSFFVPSEPSEKAGWKMRSICRDWSSIIAVFPLKNAVIFASK
jgi:hypothetical protein